MLKSIKVLYANSCLLQNFEKLDKLMEIIFDINVRKAKSTEKCLCNINYVSVEPTCGQGLRLEGRYGISLCFPTEQQ